MSANPGSILLLILIVILILIRVLRGEQKRLGLRLRLRLGEKQISETKSQVLGSILHCAVGKGQFVNIFAITLTRLLSRSRRAGKERSYEK